MLVDIKTGVYKRALFLTGGVVALLVSAIVMGEMTTSEKYELIPIAVILGIVGTLLVLRYPLVGFALMFFFVSLAPITQLNKSLTSGKMILGGNSLSSLIALLLAGIFLSRVLLLHEKVKFDRLFLFICAFILWAIITTLWAQDIRLSFIFIFRIIQMAILYILVLNYCRSQKQLNIFMISFILGTIIAAAIPLLTGTSSGGLARASLTEVDPNFFSAGVGIGMILIFSYLRKMRHIAGKALLISGILFTGYLIIRAQSRGVWIAISASFLVSTILIRRDSKSIKTVIKIIALLIGVLISAYLVGIIDKDIIARFKTLFVNPEVATSERNYIWTVGLRMIEDTFPLGVGFKNFGVVYNTYAADLNLTHVTGVSRDPHNAFIAVLAETGLIGFAIFVGIFIYLFKDVWRIKNPIERFIYMWLLAYLALISSSLSFHYSSWFWSILIFIALGIKLNKQSTLMI